MNKKTKYLYFLLVLSFVFLNGCSSSPSTYTGEYPAEQGEELVNHSLFPKEEIAQMSLSQDQLFINYELSVEDDQYTLTSKAFTGNPETKEAYTVGDNSSIAITILNTATGKVLEQTDDHIKIDKATAVTFSIPEDEADVVGVQLAEILTLADAGSSSPFGTWTSEDYPDLLNSVPTTTFFITEDGTITGWE